MGAVSFAGAAAGKYLRELDAVRASSGHRRQAHRRKAAKLRKRMIGKNRNHNEDLLKQKVNLDDYEREMPEKFRELYDQVMGMEEGRKALDKYIEFWGVPPTRIHVFKIPGPSDKAKVFVGMGHTGKGGKIRTPDGRVTRAKGVRFAATDPDGKRIFLFTGKDSDAPGSKLKKVGVAEETHYVPTRAMEKAGTFKKDKYWVHRHDDDGGEFPEVFRDQAGNYIYGEGTYRINDWIRR